MTYSQQMEHLMTSREMCLSIYMQDILGVGGGSPAFTPSPPPIPPTLHDGSQSARPNSAQP